MALNNALKKISATPQGKEENSMPFIRMWQDADYNLLVHAEIDGPPDSVYAGGLFKFTVDCSEGYPAKRPTILAQTPIYHPNFDASTGSICLDVLKKTYTATASIRALLFAIYNLFTNPDPDDPLDPNIGLEFKTNYPEFQKKAREYTLQFAIKNQPTQKPDTPRGLRLRREADDITDQMKTKYKGFEFGPSVHDRLLYEWSGTIFFPPPKERQFFKIITTDSYPAEKPVIKFANSNSIGSANQPVGNGKLKTLDGWTAQNHLVDVVLEMYNILTGK